MWKRFYFNLSVSKCKNKLCLVAIGIYFKSGCVCFERVYC